MIDVSFIIQLLEQQYAITPMLLEDLQQYDLDWRAIYRVEEGGGHSSVLRVVCQQQAPRGFSASAVLRWLEQRSYLAPRVRPTRTGAAVGAQAGWWTLLTTFIPGRTIDLVPHELWLLGDALGRLHRVELPSDEWSLPDSAWHPRRAVARALQELSAAAVRLPSELQPLWIGLDTTLRHVQQHAGVPLCIIHGDCWYANAVQTEADQAVFIDWDNAGLGPAILDVGNLLLTSHYNLAQPTEVQPNQTNIRAIIAGYCRQRRLQPAEREILLDAIRFGLAYHGAPYLAGLTGAWGQDIVLQKLRARFAATSEIAAIAHDCLRELA